MSNAPDEQKAIRKPKPKRKPKRKQLGPPPPVDEVIAAAVRASDGESDRGHNPIDRRFRWHVMGKLDDALSARPPRSVPTGLYRCLLGDGALLRDALMTVQAYVAAIARGAASVIVGGSTGLRLEQAGKVRWGKAPAGALGDVSDIDVDVYVAPEHADRLAEVVAAVDRACVDVTRDAAFADACEARMPPRLTSRKERFPARVYTANERSGLVVAIDVPSLTPSAPRVRAGHVFTTRNDTLTGTVLHRIRVALALADTTDACDDADMPPRSIPLVDIKTRLGAAPPTVARRVAGLQVRVPTAKHAMAELERLLDRSYPNVDPTKDAARRGQLAHLKASLTR